MKRTLSALTLVVFTVLLSAIVVFPQSGLEDAKSLYDQGEYSESIRILRAQAKLDKKNPEVWNLLGLNYLKTNDAKGAKKSFRNAVKYGPGNTVYLGNLAIYYLTGAEFDKAEDNFKKVINLEPQNANAHFYLGTTALYKGKFESAIEYAEDALALDPTHAAAAVLKMDATVRFLAYETSSNGYPELAERMLASARLTLEECLGICPDTQVEVIKERMESFGLIESHLRYRAGLGNLRETTGEGWTNIVVKSKPRPGYTDAARERGVRGTVIILVEFRKDGKIGFAIVLKGLPAGLTERAVAAAKRIEFDPATFEGRPESVLKVVHFNFTIY